MGSAKFIVCACGERIDLSASPIPACPRCGLPVSASSGAPSSPAADAELEHVLLKKGWTTLEKLQEARRKQAELSEQGRSASLADVLVGLQIVPPERLREAEALREKAPMKCPKCGKTYTVRGYRPGTRALCKTCKTALVPAGSITDVQPDDNGTDLQQVPVGEAIDSSMVDVIPGYQLERLLGAGGMGQVFLARQKSLDRLVAIKILPEKLSQNSEYVSRFLTEARTAAKLNHENIVSAIDAGQAGSIHYFIMEYVEGETLQSLLQREGTLPERRALEIARQVVTGLWQASQQGLIHRDIKPANIMITRTGMAKICDFGLARDTRSDIRMTQGSVV
ncbi:MAG TPA: serine/threonine-protein kinase, partial [Planctomycetota bacterium]|nr:serine/threonine-protein kinase [Planctomycetota bacterium]